jgi:hypothetical protein
MAKAKSLIKGFIAKYECIMSIPLLSPSGLRGSPRTLTLSAHPCPSQPLPSHAGQFIVPWPQESPSFPWGL